MIPPKVLLIGSSLIVTSLVSGGVGWKIRDADYQRHLKADAEGALHKTNQTRTLEHASTGVSTQAAQALDTSKQGSAAVTRKLQASVASFVPQRVDPHGEAHGADGPSGEPSVEGGVVPAGGSVSIGFGRLLDYAATGTTPPLPTPSREYLSRPSGIGMSAVAGSIIGNYGMCRDWHDEVMAWRGWYNTQAALWEAPDGK